ncbi:hypothetical protein [Pseudonocardia acaciae]|uniref:hypothetical protein n=1 Tax=Pseudonocardia acaciae TaxID=551276 RepID=UPI0006875930|nr:hypothetical protein [Pseudonocardia acaciae]
MATSSRLGRYLGSPKNLAGSTAGLAGLGLHLAGVIGSWWPAAVAVLYAAGALLAPPPADVRELAGLRRDVERLRRRTAAEARRLPARAAHRVDEVTLVLRDILADRDALDAHPTARASATHAVHIDLPELIDRHLSLPSWQDRAHAEALFNQDLDVIAAHLTDIAADLSGRTRQ